MYIYIDVYVKPWCMCVYIYIFIYLVVYLFIYLCSMGAWRLRARTKRDFQANLGTRPLRPTLFFS